MSKYELKTRVNDGDVIAFLNSIENEKRKEDAFRALDLIQELSGEEPRMWGKSIVGFGSYHYKYKSGQEGDWMRIGFSPRKQSLTMYIMNGFSRYDSLLSKIGKHKTGVGCLYIQKWEDVDEKVLRELVRESLNYMEKKYPPN